MADDAIRIEQSTVALVGRKFRCTRGCEEAHPIRSFRCVDSDGRLQSIRAYDCSGTMFVWAFPAHAEGGAVDFVRAIQRDSRREGLEEAAKACVGLTKLFVGRDDALGAQYACVEAIRKLAKESGVGDG